MLNGPPATQVIFCASVFKPITRGAMRYMRDVAYRLRQSDHGLQAWRAVSQCNKILIINREGLK